MVRGQGSGEGGTMDCTALHGRDRQAAPNGGDRVGQASGSVAAQIRASPMPLLRHRGPRGTRRARDGGRIRSSHPFDIGPTPGAQPQPPSNSALVCHHVGQLTETSGRRRGGTGRGDEEAGVKGPWGRVEGKEVMLGHEQARLIAAPPCILPPPDPAPQAPASGRRLSRLPSLCNPIWVPL